MLPAVCMQIALLAAGVTGCRSTGVRTASPDRRVISWRGKEPVPAIEPGRLAPARAEEPAVIASNERTRPSSAAVASDVQQVTVNDLSFSVAGRESDAAAVAPGEPTVENRWRAVKKQLDLAPATVAANTTQPTGTRVPAAQQLLPVPRSFGTDNSPPPLRPTQRDPWDAENEPSVVPARATDSTAVETAAKATPLSEAKTVAMHWHDNDSHVIDDHRDSAPRELAKVSLPAYIIEPPDILLIEALGCLPEQTIAGEHLVRPDGTVGLGIYGSQHVAGLTLDEAKTAIEKHLGERVKNPRVSIDVIAYNSKVYYVVTDGGGYGEQVFRLPITGNETVLDAISHISGLPRVASKRHIWIARPAGDGSDQRQILPINWIDITTNAGTQSNYQILPGDRIYVRADRWITFDSVVAKVTSPFERMFGLTLLGNATVRSVQFGNRGTSQGGF